MKKFLLAVSVFFVMLMSYAFAAECTLTDFSVSGDWFSVKGFISETENGRASIYIKENDAVLYIGQAEAEKDGSFDLSFEAPEGFDEGHYTANIGATDCVAKSISFVYPGDKVYVSYTPQEEPETDTETGIDVSAVKRISRVQVSGKVTEKQTDDDKVMLVIKKAETNDLSSETVAYIDQTNLDEKGGFEFDFNYYESLSGYVAYLYADGRDISENIEIAKAEYELVTAEVEISKVLDKAVLLARLTNDGDKEVPYTMILAMYDKNNVMVGMMAEDSVMANGASGQETIELIIPPETVRIKAMLWNSREEMIPIAKPVTAEH